MKASVGFLPRTDNLRIAVQSKRQSKGNKQLDQPLEHKQTYTVKIERTISDDIKRLLLKKCSDLRFFEDKIMFQDETLIIDIQKILLQKGHYICGFSVQKNNLKSLFGMEG